MLDDIFDKSHVKMIPFIKGWLECHYAILECGSQITSTELIRNILSLVHWSDAWRDKDEYYKYANNVTTAVFHILAEGDYNHILNWTNKDACNVAVRLKGIENWLIIYEEDENGEEYILYDKRNGGWND